MRVPNNQNEFAQRVNAMRMEGVSAVGDDGSVCVQVSGSRERVREVARVVSEAFGHVRVGDGVQEGGFFVNGVDCDVQEEV